MGKVANQHLERGIALEVAGDYDGAIAELRAALEEEPGCPSAHHHLGRIYGFTGEFDLSLHELQCAAARAPDSLPALLDLALTYAMLGMNDDAKAGFASVLLIDPDNETALKNMAYFA
jgi:Flp pilus assembly protein TadD